jgi:hypothetical protein
MRHLFEFNSLYKEGDIVLIHYWYNYMIVPVKIIGKKSKQTLIVSHNTEYSEIKNAPDEFIKISEILDKFSAN